MNNNVNMAAMNAMGGPVGGGMPMMNNGLPATGSRAVPVNDNQQKSQLNTYIYEYFLRNEMYECARAIISSDQPINVLKNSPRRRDANGNPLDNGVGSDDMEDSKDDIDSKRPDDLPPPNLPKECPESCFLYEWWCLFWDMFNAQRGKGDARNVLQYANITQQQSRFKQENQASMLRQMREQGQMGGQMNPQMAQLMRAQQNGMGMGSNEIARKAMNNNRNITPQHAIMLQQQQQAHQKQQQMQRDGSGMDGDRQRPQSPGSAENAPSPSKRPRLDNGGFNGGPQGMMPNGRGQGGMPGQQAGAGPAGNVAQNAGMIIANGIPQAGGPQFQNFPGGPGQAPNQMNNPKSLQAYTNNLVQHQQGQMANKGMQNPGGPQNQGSPMMTQGQDGNAIATYYNADMAANGLRQGVPGQQGGGNHALQDYQMQLMLLEQQNKKRLMMARQEQEGMVPRDGSGGPTGPGGPGGPGQNGQPFQGTSPQGGPRSVNSPNPSEQMKRGTPQMNTTGIPSPIPDGQSRGSPSAGMNFMPNQMDPNMGPHFYKQMNGGMEGNMMANGMRPPSSHPQAPFNGQMTQQQMMMARQQQAQAQQQQQAGLAGQVQQQWPNNPNAPNGAPMMQQQPSQGPTPQPIGTPQQRAMPPPSAPAATATGANGRTQPSSPQQPAAPPTPSQTNKANPKGKKDTKPKRNAKKGSTTTGATPATEGAAEPATPTPATPITPIHPQSFNKTGQANGQVANNAQTTAPAVTSVPVMAQPQPDPTQASSMEFGDGSMFNIGMDFANPAMGNGDVLQDFDFDSFLHQDGGDNDGFAFDTSAFMDNEIGAE